MGKGERMHVSSGYGDFLCCTLRPGNLGTKLKTAIFESLTICNIYYLKGFAKLFVLRLGKCILFMVIPHFFPMNIMLAGKER